MFRKIIGGLVCLLVLVVFSGISDAAPGENTSWEGGYRNPLIKEIINDDGSRLVKWWALMWRVSRTSPSVPHSGGTTRIINLDPGFSKVILYSVCFDDNGYIEINGIRVFTDNGAYNSAGCMKNLNVDITHAFNSGDNEAHEYAIDSAGGSAMANMYIWIYYPPAPELTFEEIMDERVEDLGLAYDATGSIHAYPNLLWPPNNKNRAIILEGYFIDKLAMLRFGGTGVNGAWAMVDGNVVGLIWVEIDGKFTYRGETTVKATKGSIYPVELYVMDSAGNEALVDSTYITVPNNMNKSKK